MTDTRVLDRVADAMGQPLGLPDLEAARRELRALGTWTGARASGPAVESSSGHRAVAEPASPGRVVLASWRMLLDESRAEDGEPYLARTARAPVARMSAATAAEIGVADGDAVSVSAQRGTITLPLVVTEMCDGVVWVPGNSPGSSVRRDLVAAPGDVVQVSPEVST
jgi:NADH-quinone oxidoreductase subunit G